MDKILKRINEINARFAEIDNLLNTAEGEELTNLDKESKELVQERARLEAQRAEEIRKGYTGATAVAGQVETAKVEEIEERARKLKQGRAISIGSLDILHINHQSGVASPAFNEVSHLVDLIPVTQLSGGETYQKAYIKGYGVAGYTAEGAAATTTQPSLSYADIKKTKLTAYTEVSEEFEKLAPGFYLDEVKKNLSIALKKKLAAEILNGAGTTNALVGIFSAAATAVEGSKDIEIDTINEHTLDDLIFGYGGEEDITEGVLILNKADLKAFSKVRGSDKKRVYVIDKRNRTIDGIPYIINSNVKALSDDATVGGEYVMAYGSLSNYTLTSFSPVELTKSTDYKFAEGQVAYKAVGFFGGNVTSWNGFLRVKKKAAG